MKRSFLIASLCAVIILGYGRLGEAFLRLDMVVMDSSPTPKLVGLVGNMSQIGGSLPEPRIFRVFTKLKFGGVNYIIYLRITPQGLGENGPGIFFKLPDCQGTAFISEQHFNAELSFLDPHATRIHPDTPGKLRLYAAKRGARPIEENSMNSELRFFFGCVNLGSPLVIRSAIADLVDGDLTNTFKPPYFVIPGLVNN